MIINFLLTEIRPSGGTKIMIHYANYLSRRGHDVVVYYPLSGYYTGLKKILWPKAYIQNIKLDGKSWFDPEFQLCPVFSINDKSVRKADITVASFWVASLWLSKLSPNKGKKVYFIQGREKDYHKGHRKLVEKTYAIPFDKFITISADLKKEIDSYGCDCCVVPNGIHRNEIPEMFALRDEEYVVVALPYREGEEIKNCDMAIKVLKNIEKTSENAKIRAFGFKKPAWWDETGWEFIENPTKEKLYSFYEDIDILYVPSIYEGWGLPAMEAMAHGRVVVMGDFGVFSEIGVDNENCLKINDPKDVDEAVAKIASIIGNAERRNHISYNAYETIKQMSDIDECANLFERELLKLCN